MVGEFPELQGIMGGYYARAQGEDDAVADAVRDHYKPVGQGDDVPTAPVTVAVSLADKLDTLVGFYLINEKPTGSRDPFALRRAALGFLDILNTGQQRLSIWEAITRSLSDFTRQMLTPEISSADYEAYQVAQKTVFIALPEFFADRLKVQQREAGVRHDLIDAVFALGGEDDLVRLLARVKALQAFVSTDEGANLLAGYKRAANILKQAEGGQSSAPAKAGAQSETDNAASRPSSDGSGLLPSQEHEKEDTALLAALNAAEPKAAAAIEAEDFEGAMAALASLRAPIDAFFDGVMVNDPDEQKRAFRLGLLARFRDAVHRVADFSRIEG